jgi:hypothetical protein
MTTRRINYRYYNVQYVKIRLGGAIHSITMFEYSQFLHHISNILPYLYSEATRQLTTGDVAPSSTEANVKVNNHCQQ